MYQTVHPRFVSYCVSATRNTSTFSEPIGRDAGIGYVKVDAVMDRLGR